MKVEGITIINLALSIIRVWVKLLKIKTRKNSPVKDGQILKTRKEGMLCINSMLLQYCTVLLKLIPIHSHRCTDILFLLLILAAWFGMTIIGLIVLGAIQDDHLSTGNPYRLTNPIDYAGKICGFDDGVKDLKKGYYLSLIHI